MQLTREQEEFLLMKYEPFIRSRVNKFHKRGRQDAMDNYEDFLQEARLAFLILIREKESIQDVVHCENRLLEAMNEYCRRMAVVYIPRKKFPEYRRCFSQTPYDTNSAVETTEMLSEDHVVGAVETAQFIETLTDDERTILHMKENGSTNREIMPVIHARNEPHMCRLVKRLQQKVLAFVCNT